MNIYGKSKIFVRTACDRNILDCQPLNKNIQFDFSWALVKCIKLSSHCC